MGEGDLGGFGQRVTKVELAQGQQEVRVERNEEEIQKLWDTMDEKVEDLRKGQTTTIIVVIASVAIPTMLILYQLMNK